MKRQSFARFCAHYGFDLTPAQDATTAVCFDDVSPCELPDEGRAIAAKVFGPIDVVPAAARGVVVFAKGARVGGTRMASMELYRRSNAVALHLAPGETAFGLIVGPDMRLARQGLGYVMGAAHKDHADGRITILSETKDSVTFERHDGSVITIECLPATAGGSAVRARTLVGAVITEASFMKDANFVVNDEEIYRAIAPRIVPGGILIIESTLWAAVGLLHDLFVANHGQPTTAIAAHCPTLLMRTDDHTRAVVEREYQRNPQNAAFEFGAQFRTTAASSVFDPAHYLPCFLPDVSHLVPVGRHIVAVDLSSGASKKADTTAFALAVVARPLVDESQRWLRVPHDAPNHEDLLGASTIQLDDDGTYRKIARDERGNPIPNPEWERLTRPILVLSAVHSLEGDFAARLTFNEQIDMIGRLGRSVGAKIVLGDTHNEYPAKGRLAEAWSLPWETIAQTAPQKATEVETAIRLFKDRTIAIHADGPEAEKLKQELGAFAVKYGSGGTAKYEARSGFTDDRISCLLMACFALESDRGFLEGAPFRRGRGSHEVTDRAPGWVGADATDDYEQRMGFGL